MHLRNQNGRSNVDSGHGSRGKGGLATSGFGEPGIVGEWISLPKRWIPSADRPSIRKLDEVGVGMAGTAVEGTRHCLPAARPLSEGFGTTSEGSVVDTERILFFKLEEEKFFFIPLEPDLSLRLKRPGESGIEGMLSKLSAEVTFVRAGVAGIVLGVPSAGLGVGNGDDPLRLAVWLMLEIDSFKARFGAAASGCDEVADRGGSGNGCAVSNGGSDEA